MVYIDLRYTPPADEKEHEKKVNNILNFFIELNNDKQSYLDDILELKLNIW